MCPLDEKTPLSRESTAPAPPVSGPQAPDRKPQAGRSRRRWLIVLVALLAIAVVAGGVDWWLSTEGWISTDDAFVGTHLVQISPQVAGRVKAVLVNDNEKVRAGQPLVKLDPADFQARLDQALADRQSALGQLSQAKATLVVARADVDEARAEVGVAQAAATNAAINRRRAQALARLHSLAQSRQQLDNAIASARSDAAKLAAARQKVAAAKARRALDRTHVKTARAGVRAARAQLDQARLALSYTVIRASEPGHVAKLNVAPGSYVEVGQALMALVPEDVWVIANFRETLIGKIHVSDPVDIHIDAYPGHVFHGHVQSVQPGSGAAFSLLPPENATGNYVKVVQRVPVKIVFDGHPGRRWLLGPGMSVEPDVKIN